MNYSYEIADEKDDPELRRFIASMPMPGNISIRMERNPDFFEASSVEGNVSETLVVRAEGKVTGIGIRSEKKAYVNGRKQRLGYLSGLRVNQNHRSLLYLTKAYRELEKLHEQGEAEFYLTTIVGENARAVKVLESGRGGLPVYTFRGNFLTFAIPPFRHSSDSGADIRKAGEADLYNLVEYLNTQGQTKQYFPCYQKKDFKDGLLKGLNNIYIAEDKNRICGCIGLWDQQRYKQICIDSYSTSMKMIRPFYNFQALLRKCPPLPAAGSKLDNLKVAIPLAETEGIMLDLLYVAAKEAGKLKKPLLYGIHEKDPFTEVLQRVKSRIYKSRLYTVHWPDGEKAVDSINEFVPYLELGGL